MQKKTTRIPKTNIGLVKDTLQAIQINAISSKRKELDRLKENIGVTIGNAKRLQQIEQMEVVIRTMKDSYINKYKQAI